MKYFRGLTAALIGLTALWLTGCAVSRTATKESVESRVAEERITEARDSTTVRESAGSQAGSGTARASPVVQALKWAFWTVVAVGLLIFGLKVFKLFHF